MAKILRNPNEQILYCPHCKKEGYTLEPAFMFESYTETCRGCNKVFTIQYILYPNGGLISTTSDLDYFNHRNKIPIFLKSKGPIDNG